MDYNLHDESMELAHIHDATIEDAVFKMKEAFDDGSLTVNGYEIGVDELLEHVVENEMLDTRYKADVLRYARGVDCGADHVNFWDDALESLVESLADEWIQERRDDS